MKRFIAAACGAAHGFCPRGFSPAMAAQAHSTIDRIWLRLSAAKDAQSVCENQNSVLYVCPLAGSNPRPSGRPPARRREIGIFFLFLAATL
jgi:hypothetical protein